MTELRPALRTDLEAVSSLERAVFGADAWSPRSVEQELDAAGDVRHILVAVADARVVGYAALAYSDDAADLLRVAVAPDHQRQGVAYRLCVALLDVAAGSGCTRILLEVAADNAPALALYTRLGFTEIDRRRRYYTGSIDAVVMQLALVAGGRPAERTIRAHSKNSSRPLEGPFAPARRRGERT